MFDPNTASGAADAQTPTGPNEFMLDEATASAELAGADPQDLDDDDPTYQGEEHADDAEIVRQIMKDMPDEEPPPIVLLDTGRTSYNSVGEPPLDPGVYTNAPSGIAAVEETYGDAPVSAAAFVSPPTITGTFINTILRNLRAPFEAKKKRGVAFKGARARLDKRADEAVREFRSVHLPELNDDQALRISLGITGLVGDSHVGFAYVESADE